MRPTKILSFSSVPPHPSHHSKPFYRQQILPDSSFSLPSDYSIHQIRSPKVPALSLPYWRRRKASPEYIAEWAVEEGLAECHLEESRLVG